MRLIDIIKPLSTVLSSVVSKSELHVEKNSSKRQELSLGLLFAKHECYPLCYAASPIQIKIFHKNTLDKRMTYSFLIRGTEWFIIFRGAVGGTKADALLAASTVLTFDITTQIWKKEGNNKKTFFRVLQKKLKSFFVSAAQLS